MGFSQTVWEAMNPIQGGNYLYSVTSGKSRTSDSIGLFTIVGEGGAISTSPDDTSWAVDSSGTTQDLNFVTFCDSISGGTTGMFIAAGSSGVILTSSDGTIWSTDTSVTKEDLYGVAYAKAGLTGPSDLFVAIGDSGAILTSSDGVTWELKKSGTVQNLSSIIFANGFFVAAGDSGVILTSPDGTSWTKRNSGTINGLCSVSYGNTIAGSQPGRFVAVGTHGAITSSPDGIAWTTNASGTIGFLFDVTYGDSQFVAVGENGIVLAFSDSTWKGRSSVTNSDLHAVTFNKDAGQFMAVGADGTVIVAKADTFATPATGVLSRAGMKYGPGNFKINAVNNRISITVPSAGPQSRLAVNIFNIAGKRIYLALATAQNNGLTFSAVGLPGGKYVLSVSDEKGRTVSSSFILMR
jgi:hypothetical protein